MSRPTGGTVEIHVVKGDITGMDFDVLVLPTSTTGTGATGGARKIVHKGGKALEREAVDAAPIAVGAALITEGGRLSASHVIHVPVSLTPGAKVGVENVRRATRAALIAANAKGYPTIAIPPMCLPQESGIPAIEIARAMLDEIRGHRHPKPENVYIVDEDGTVARMAMKILESLK